GGGRAIGEASLAESARDPRRLLVFLFAVQHFGENVLDRHPGREDRVLRDIADAQASSHGTSAAVGLFDSRQNLQESRLAGAVRADQADVIALRNAEAEILEERARGKGLRERLAGQENGHWS